MAIPLGDLPPRGDVKGGAPRTPIPPLTVSEYQQSLLAPNGHGIWRALACGLAGLNVGLVLAWFTAVTNKGVTTKEMQEYVKDFSPYNKDVERLIAEHNQTQDTNIGILTGKEEKLSERIGTQEAIQKDQDRDLIDCKKGMKNAADFIEESRKVRK